MTRLWCITFEFEDGEPMNLFTVGVDMDEKTAEALVLKERQSVYEETGDNDTLENYSVTSVYFEAVPEKVDGWDVVLTKEGV